MIPSIDSAASAGGVFGSVGANGNNGVQDMFTKLLIAQVQYQDPMKPMDNMEFTNQLAMFNQLNEMQSMNGTLGQLLDQNTVMSQSSYLNLLGKKVVASGSSLSVNEPGTPQQINFNLDGNADNTTLEIFDTNGIKRATLDLGARDAGENTFNWDGTDENGMDLFSGDYTVQITGENNDGSTTNGTMRVSGNVSTVSTVNGEVVLQLENGQDIMVNQIIRVETPNSPNNNNNNSV